MIQVLLPLLTSIGGQVAKSLFPDPEQQQKREEAQNLFMAEIMKQAQAMELAAADIVKAEAQSQNWLASSWRPITMLTFLALIVARWMGYTAPGISEEEVLKLWDIIQLGLGGYVIGRSVEKVVPSVAEALKKR